MILNHTRLLVRHQDLLHVRFLPDLGIRRIQLRISEAVINKIGVNLKQQRIEKTSNATKN